MPNCIALSETIINNSVRDEDIYIEGFSKEVFRSDHQSGDKRVVYVFTLKKLFPLNVERIWKVCKKLSLLRQLYVAKIFFVAIYRSPNQSSEEFDLFQENLQNIIDNIKDLRPHCVILTGDFNCRSNQWWPGDKNLPEGIALDDLFESYDMTQLIDQPTNVEPRGISCVDLIVTDHKAFIHHSTIAVTTKLFMGNSMYLSPYLPYTKGKSENIQKPR